MDKVNITSYVGQQQQHFFNFLPWILRDVDLREVQLNGPIDMFALGDLR